jgi:hypothetical protein
MGDAMIRIAVAILFFLLSGAIHSPAQEPESVRVSGRVVDGHGTPRAGVQLTLAPSDPTDKSAPVTTSCRYDGSFSFRNIQPKKYNFVVRGGAFTIKPTIDIESTGDTNVGEIEIDPEVTTTITEQQIIIDSRIAEHPKIVSLPLLETSAAQ